mgnify:CR=1 FL=1
MCSSDLLVPLGVWLAMRLIPAEVMDECRARVAEQQAERPRTRWAVAAAIVVVWLLAGGLIVYWLVEYIRK